MEFRMKATRVKITSLFMILLMGSAAAVFASGQSTILDSLIGTWDVELDKGAFMEFVFKMEEGTLVGELVSEKDSDEMENLSFEGNKLTFSSTKDYGSKVFTMNFIAEVEGNTMAGYIDTEMGTSDFTATKRE